MHSKGSISIREEMTYRIQCACVLAHHSILTFELVVAGTFTVGPLSAESLIIFAVICESRVSAGGIPISRTHVYVPIEGEVPGIPATAE